MLKILIVDDMEIVRRELKRINIWGEISGFVISDEARDGYEALQKLRVSPVDLVITDIRMPKVDGIELLKKVSEEKLCPCIVLMSDYSEFSYARQGLVLGAFDYIVKPIDEQELKRLLGRVKELIADKKAEQQRVSELEQSLLVKKDQYFPQYEIDQLVELIKSGDAKTIEYAVNIIETVWTKLNGDIIKIQDVLNNSHREIYAKTLQAYGWLNKFITTESAFSVHSLALRDLDSAIVLYTNKLEGLMTLLFKLKFASIDNQMINQIIKCVLENVDGDVSLKAVSDMIYMNKTYVSEVFKQRTGTSFTEYVTAVKMERAKKLIVEGQLKTYEIAEFLGFKNIEYFSKLFKKYVGCTPTEYKQQSSNSNRK